jgi:hypothetical protein
MGLFFHELETDFEHYGTSHWKQESSISSVSILSGQFIEKSYKSREAKIVKFCLTN